MLWATPKKRDYRSGGTTPARIKARIAYRQATNQPIDLPEQITVNGGGSLLNADWVEQLMGYPVGWTNPDGLPDKARPNLRGKHHARSRRKRTRTEYRESRRWGMQLYLKSSTR